MHRGFLCLMLIFVFSFNVYALGITPGRSTFDFSPLEEINLKNNSRDGDRYRLPNPQFFQGSSNTESSNLPIPPLPVKDSLTYSLKFPNFNRLNEILKNTVLK